MGDHGAARRAVSTGATSDLLDAVAPEARALLDLLASGVPLGQAAGILHLSRRTADRRMAEVRRALGVRTTTAALVLVRVERSQWVHDPVAGDAAHPGPAGSGTRWSASRPGAGSTHGRPPEVVALRPHDRGARVTAREREVLGLVGLGWSNPEIAAHLGVSRPTVRRLLANARCRLGARDRVEAAAMLLAASH